MGRKKRKKGGQREGAGRPLKYGEKTEPLSIAVPASKKAEIKAKIEERLPEIIEEINQPKG